MAYNAVSQADHDATYHASDSDASRSPSPRRRSFQQLPLDADHIGGGSYLQPAKSTQESNIPSLGSMIRSMTATSYDMVEEDDYEAVDPSASRRSNSPRRVPPLNTTVGTTTAAATTAAVSPTAHAASPGPPLRTPITDTPVPLSHPTPGLESLQGAYLNNVERLERSAERLSSSSADIGSEIRRMNREQKKRSSSSASNATAADGFPVRANMSSRQGSIQSASRLAQVSEHGPEERYYQSTRDPVEPVLPPPPPPPPMHLHLSHVDLDFNYNPDQYDHPPPDEIERPATAASNDTYQQAGVLFGDFDGVHYVPHDKAHDLARQVSLTRPPLARNSESHKEPQNGEDMVYYPAPVPRMLNLPPRLSQRPNIDREKRRTQLLGSVPSENRKSAPWLAAADPQDGSAAKPEKQLKDLPPQLRASVFFEPPAATIDIDVKKESAVATLDSILDASAHAPVTAFTDHPYAGHLGREVYGSTKPKTLRKKNPSRSTLLAPQQSDSDTRANSLASRPPYLQTEAEAANMHEGTSLRDGPGEDGEHSGGDEEEGNEPEVPFTGPPTTLLAELEQRKHQLKQRNRTAATDAMHSTLLQMDAVAQKQSENRRQRPITLAWESNDAHNVDDEEDDDVPLGMLYPDKTHPADEQRPLGLMEKREMEEGEPLSHRRARLRGEAPPPPPRTPDRRPTTMYSQHAPAPAEAAEPESGDEGETLAQRISRMKATNRTSTAVESEFATEILAELSHLQGDDDKPKEVAPEDETLAQRRARLQKEAEAKNSTLKIPRYRRSMADILHARRPVIPRPPINETAAAAAAPQRPVPQRHLDHRMSMQQFPTNFGMSGRASYHPGAARTDSFGPGLAHPNTFYSDAVLGMGHMSYAMPHNYHQRVAPSVIDPGQREVIDRWRQSIV